MRGVRFIVEFYRSDPFQEEGMEFVKFTIKVVFEPICALGVTFSCCLAVLLETYLFVFRYYKYIFINCILFEGKRFDNGCFCL